MNREFWYVKFERSDLESAQECFYVFAKSAAEAESKGIPLAQKAFKEYAGKGDVECVSAEFQGHIEA